MPLEIFTRIDLDGFYEVLMLKKIAIMTLSLAAISSSAYASEGDQCATACPSGQVQVSFLGGGENGADVTCACFQEPSGSMPDNSSENYGDENTQQHEYTGE